jgi:hypothetical protein
MDAKKVIQSKIEFNGHFFSIRSQMLIERYAVVNYVNGRITHTIRSLSKKAAYDAAIPIEAHSGTRWHVILYDLASERIDLLFIGETFRICWQDYNPNFDTEHVLIVREEDKF